jgi:PAS domain S-box-containing protein
MSGPETELLASKRELGAIYANVPGILFYVSVEPDDEFRFLSMSQTGLAAMGMSAEQVIGARVRDVIPSPSLEMVLEHYREAIRTGQTVRWDETSVYPAGTRHGEVAVTPLVDPSGVTTHLIGIVHDVTERRRAEAVLRESNARLEEADRRKDEFLAMLGHELRNPLAVIQMAAEVLRRQGDVEPRRPQDADMIDMIRRQARELSRMVDDFLEVSRITSRRLALKKEPFCIPVDSVEPAKDGDPLASAARDRRKRNILVVDDNRDLAEGLAALLTSWGHDVRVAHNGPSVLSIASEFRPEIVFLDIGLPLLDGYEVARRLRRLPGLERIALIALTGYGEPKDHQQSQEAGFALHLVKPVDSARLEEALAAIR